MSVTVTVRDQSMKGETLRESMLEFLTEKVTVRELIRSRVYQEVREYNAKQPQYFHGLVQPTDAEKTLNGYKIRKARMIDWEGQYKAAVEAFERKQVLVLADDRQLDQLAEELVLRHDTKVTFIKLVFLTGG